MSYDLDVSDIQESSPDLENSNIEDNSQPAPQQEPARQLFKYQANGKEIEEDLDTILQRASQGYNYAQHMNEFKSRQEAFEAEKNQVNQMRSKWEQYDKYASDNPEWAEHVKNAWENRGKQSTEAEAKDIPEALKKEFDELRMFKEQFQKDMQLRKEAEEDAILAKQFEDIKKNYPDYDLSHTDPRTGMSLEMQILEHARVNGIHSVKAAFRDLMFDDIMSKQITKAKEAAAKELQDRTKKGFLAESSKSLIQTGVKPPKKGVFSYANLAMDGAKELGLL